MLLTTKIIPAIVSPELTLEDLKGFADAVFDRFQNPFIKHKLLDISLNSTSKWEARVLHTINEYYAQKKELPKILTFSFAAYLAFYRGTEIREGALIGKRGDEEYLIKDAPEVLEFYKKWKLGQALMLLTRLRLLNSLLRFAEIKTSGLVKTLILN